MYKDKKISIPFRYRMVRGAIGKRIVIKHYRYGIVVTKYPKMQHIKASDKQAACRKLFKEAVALAKLAYADATAKQMWRKKLGNPASLFGAIVKAYLQQLKTAKAERVAVANTIISECFAADEPAGIIEEKIFNERTRWYNRIFLPP